MLQSFSLFWPIHILLCPGQKNALAETFRKKDAPSLFGTIKYSGQWSTIYVSTFFCFYSSCDIIKFVINECFFLFSVWIQALYYTKMWLTFVWDRWHIPFSELPTLWSFFMRILIQSYRTWNILEHLNNFLSFPK